MTYGIRIVGLANVQRMLGTDFRPAIAAATKAIALEVQGAIAPYPPSTIANSPGNPSGRWYERGYGPRWRTAAGVNGRKTSQTLGRRWAVKQRGTGATVGNSATYAPFLHSKERQVRWAGTRGWQTDEGAIRAVIASGAVKRIVTQAIMARLRRR